MERLADHALRGEAWALAEGAAPADLVQIDVMRCLSFGIIGMLDRAVEAGLQALEAATRLDADGLLLTARYALGTAFWFGGELERAKRILLDGLDRVRADPLRSGDTAGTASVLYLVCLSKTHALAGDFDAAAQVAAEASAIAATTGRPYDLGIARPLGRGRRAARRGRRADGAAGPSGPTGLVRRHGFRPVEAQALRLLGGLEPEAARAEQHLRAASRLAGILRMRPEQAAARHDLAARGGRVLQDAGRERLRGRGEDVRRLHDQTRRPRFRPRENLSVILRSVSAWSRKNNASSTTPQQAFVAQAASACLGAPRCAGGCGGRPARVPRLHAVLLATPPQLGTEHAQAAGLSRGHAVRRPLLLAGLRGRHLAGNALAGIPGMAVRRVGRLVPPARRADPVTDLDALPYPDFHDFFAQRRSNPAASAYAPSVTFETALGCWWGAKQHCTFCGLNGPGMAFRSKSQDRAFDELSALVRRYGVRDVANADNILDMAYFGRFLPRLAEERPGLSIFYEVKANLKPWQLALLWRACAASNPALEASTPPCCA